jgi:hypothetical protein
VETQISLGFLFSFGHFVFCHAAQCMLLYMPEIFIGTWPSEVLTMDTQEHLRNVSDRRGFVVLEKANTDLVRVTCMVTTGIGVPKSAREF